MNTIFNIHVRFAFMCTAMTLLFVGSLYDYIPDPFTYPFLFIVALPFMITAIVEMNAAEKLDQKEKTMWTFGFIVTPLLTGIIYMASLRKKILLG